MTSLLTFLETCWWIIPLSLLVLFFLSGKVFKICQGKRVEYRTGDSALEILDRRYASGEIGPMEYLDKVLTMGIRSRW